MITESIWIALAGLTAVVVLLFLLITRYKWHVFAAFLVPILIFAAAPGLDREAFITAFEEGFGGTIESIAVVIVLGSILAEALKHTGAVERITTTMIGWVGERRMPLALTLSGFVIGVAIFSDVGYVILNPLVHSAALKTGLKHERDVHGARGSHAAHARHGAAHSGTPGCRGPGGSRHRARDLLRIPRVPHGGPRRVGLRSPRGPEDRVRSLRGVVGPVVHRPGAGGRAPVASLAYAPILIPLALIAGQSVTQLTLPEEHVVNAVMLYLGWPVVALTIGVLLAYRNTRREQAEARTGQWVENGLRTSAMIIVVTGLGGALSQILRATAAVDAIAEAVAATGLPAIFLPFVLGVVGNMITGSTTVGVITAAAIAAPMMETLGLSPEATMLAGAAGSIIVKYVNSSYFWVCASLSRMPLRSALLSYGGVTLVNGVVTMAAVYVLWVVGWI